MIRSLGGSIAFTIAALLLSGWLGYRQDGLITAALQMMFLAAVLGVIETSLSLDFDWPSSSGRSSGSPAFPPRLLRRPR